MAYNNPGNFDVDSIPIQPNNPRYTALLVSDDNVTGDGTAYPIIFPTTTVNVGSHYSTTTGILTVPFSGVYAGFVLLAMGGFTSSHVDMTIQSVSTVTGTTTLWKGNPWALADSSTNLTVPIGLVNKLTAAEEVYLALTVSGGAQVIDMISLSIWDNNLLYRTA